MVGFCIKKHGFTGRGEAMLLVEPSRKVKGLYCRVDLSNFGQIHQG